MGDSSPGSLPAYAKHLEFLMTVCFYEISLYLLATLSCSYFSAFGFACGLLGVLPVPICIVVTSFVVKGRDRELRRTFECLRGGAGE